MYYNYDRLQQDKELMADFKACMKYRRQHMRDVYQFSLARKYDIDYVEKMQLLPYFLLWIWLPLLYFFPHRETVLWGLLHVSLTFHWDQWWSAAFSGHQHFDYFSREELKNVYGDRWRDGPENWSQYMADAADD